MAKVVQQKEPQFDWELFGAIIRKSRMKLGYKKADVFCESIFRRARVNISQVTYYRIETGKQEPTAVQLFGICMALYGEPFPRKIFEACASDEWQSIEQSRVLDDGNLFTPASYSIPDSWKHENYKAAQERGTGDEEHPEVDSYYTAIVATEEQDYGLFMTDEDYYELPF